MLLYLFLALRIISNPCSNVLQKILCGRAASPLAIIGLTHGVMSLACLPLLWWRPPPWSGEFWWNMGLGTFLTVAGNVLIVQAVSRADLSVLGPINAYKPVVSLLPGLLLLGEVPGPLGLAGIGLIVAGSYFLADRAAGPSGLRGLFGNRGVQLRLAALVLSATEAVFLKRALLASSPLPTFAVWAVLGFVASLAAALLLPGWLLPGWLLPGWLAADQREAPADSPYHRQLQIFRANFGLFLLLSLTTGLMQLATCVTLAGLQVGYTLALFQTSTLLSVLLGHAFFREPHLLRRLLAASVMAAGAALIIISG